jgi:hypothetical protein
MVLPEAVEFDLEKGTATIPIERYKELRLAEKRYNEMVKAAKDRLGELHENANTIRQQQKKRLRWWSPW